MGIFWGLAIDCQAPKSVHFLLVRYSNVTCALAMQAVSSTDQSGEHGSLRSLAEAHGPHMVIVVTCIDKGSGSFEDFELVDYDPHPHIKAEVSV